jgi:DHA2 family multidrug resistance protein
MWPAISGGILHHMFEHTITKNFQLLSSGTDKVNSKLQLINPAELGEMLQYQALMVTFKELYGVLIILSYLAFAIFLAYNYPYLPFKTL